MLKLGIAGLGWWGKTLVKAVQGKSDRMRFVAGVTGRRHLAEDFAAAQGLRLEDDIAALLADPGIDAMVLATPHLDHEAQVIAAARAGKHVFVEKPFTMDKASAARALGAVAEAGVTIGLGHNRRFHPHMQMLRDLRDGGRLGTVLHCEGTMTAPNGLFLPKESWRARPEQSPAGGMSGLGIHMVDSMIDLIGDIAEVTCFSHHRAVPSGADDTTAVLLRFANGATGYVSCMTATAPTYRFCIYGAGGTAEIRLPGLDQFSFAPVPDAPLSGHSTPKPLETSVMPGVDTVAAELGAFAAAVAGERPFPITPAQMLHGAAVFGAIATSAADGRPVRVP